MRAALLLLLTTLSLSPQTPQPQVSRVEGVVLRTDVNAGVDYVPLLLVRQASENRSAYATRTDSAGRFVFSEVAAGRYRLVAQQPGFLPEATTVEIAGGQNRSDIVLRIVPMATISGRVYDDAGRPRARVNVQLLQRRFTPSGRQVAQLVAGAETNDLGEYRIFWVRPGSYYVSASPNPGETAREPTMDIVEQSGSAPGIFLPMLYPNSFGTDGAEPILLAPGAEVRGIDFPMNRVPTVRVQGVLVDSNGQLLPQTSIALTPLRAGWAELSILSGGRTNDKGEFVISQIPPGSYSVSATNDDATGNRLAGASDVQIGDKNIVGLRIVVQRAASVRGRVVLEPGAPPTPIGSVSFEAVGAGADGGAGVEADGTFTVSNLFAGLFRVGVNLREGYFVSAARSGSRNILRDGLDTRAAAIEPLDIQVGFTTAEIEGTVMKADGSPAAGIQAVLIPNTERAMRVDLFRRAPVDAGGRFTMKGVTPGEYKLFAWEDIEPYGYFDPNFMELYESRGTPVRVIRNQNLSVNLRSLP